jgi:hypothetical protein
VDASAERTDRCEWGLEVTNDMLAILHSHTREYLRSEFPAEGEVLPPSAPLPRYRMHNLDIARVRAGFTRAPEHCLHERKSYYSRQWTCSLCGERLD